MQDRFNERYMQDDDSTAAEEAYQSLQDGVTELQPTQASPVPQAASEGAYGQPQAGQDSYQAQHWQQGAQQPQQQPQQPYQASPYEQNAGQAPYGQASYQGGQPSWQEAPAPVAAPAKAKAGLSGLKSALLGLVGGAVGAMAVTLAMGALGVSGEAKTVTVTPSADGVAPQTISIVAQDQDITVSQAVAAKALPSVVSVHVSSSEGSGLGSGVILDTDGNILTNWHVAGDAETISVTIGTKSYDATLVGGDASSDLAVIHAELDGDTVTPIEVGDSDALVVGDWVMTIGSPFGLDQSVSAGIVSSLARNEMMQSTYGTTLYANLIQTDASINPGNSGGALVNAQGQLVGISTLFSSDTESFAGIGFAIPGNYAVKIANMIIAGEQVTHAYIGLSVQTVTAQNAAQNDLSVNQGAYVAEVVADSPADEAGIKQGDIVVALDGQAITSADGLILAVRSHSTGQTVPVTVVRGDEELTVDVTFGSDEALQALQEQQRQTQQQQGPYGNQDERDDGNSTYDLLEELYEYLYNNRGGRYDLSE